MSQRIRFAEGVGWSRASWLGRGVVAVAVALVALLLPATLYAHERWIPNHLRWPMNHAYFQRLEGATLQLTVAGTLALTGIIIAFFVVAPVAVERLTPVNEARRQAEARMNVAVRGLRYALRLLLDGPFVSRAMENGLEVATFIFSKVPAFVLALGAYQGWLVMPSYPLMGPLANVFAGASAVLAVWVLIGKALRPLGAIMFAIYGYLIYGYGIGAIDAIPVLASAFFYFFHDPESPGVNSRQLLGIRVSMGFGFFLLGLVDKIYLSDFIIGVADHYPQLVAGPQANFPDLTREGWAFAGAVGEMVFGLSVLFGVFNRATTLALTFIFSNFILVFGWAEVVHIYPIAGFLILFFRGPLGSPLTGPIFNLAVAIMDAMKGWSFHAARLLAVTIIAVGVAVGVMFIPTWFFMERLPALEGQAMAADYVPPSPPPPAKEFLGVHPARHGGIVARVQDFEVELSVTPEGAILVFVSEPDGHPVDVSEIAGRMLVGPEGKQVNVPLRRRGAGLVGMGPPLVEDTDYHYDLEVKGKQLNVRMPVFKEGTEPMVWSSQVLTVLARELKPEADQ